MCWRFYKSFSRQEIRLVIFYSRTAFAFLIMFSATSCHCSHYHGGEDLILLQGYSKLCHSAMCNLENENIPTPVLTCKPDTLLLSYGWFHPTFFFPINLPCWFNPPCLKSASSTHPSALWAVSTQRRYQSTLRCGDKVPVFVNVGFCVFSHLIWGLCLIYLAIIYFTHGSCHKPRFLVLLIFVHLK